MQQERRLSERKEPEQLIYVGLPSGNSAVVLNVSEGGFGFHAVALIEPCGLVPFWLSANSNRIEGTGELAWSDEGKKTGGLRFTQLSAGAREQIRSLPNESDRRIDSRKDFAVRPHWVEELADVPARDESPLITNETSTAPAPTSDATPQPVVLWPEMHAQMLGSPKKSYFEEQIRRRFKAIYVAVLAIIVAVLGYTYHKATEVRYTYTIPSPESNLSSEAATRSEVFDEKSRAKGVSAQATPQSSGMAKATAARPPAREASAAGVALRKPPIPRGALFVQVGAFVRKANADKVAESLRQKNFPAFIVTSQNGVFYLVHVGPYAEEESARIAQSELGKAGFKPFIRH
jgi:cell division septation protein DedD